MVGLGDLPGGSFVSGVFGVSADGSTIVGSSNSAAGHEAFRWTSAEGMVGLGDLDGSSFFSDAWGISADGSTVVGSGSSAAGPEAFRWTSAEGMVGLGDLPRGLFSSAALDASFNGSIIVGFGGSPSSGIEGEAMIWDAQTGMRSLQQVLTTEHGIDLTGWQLRDAIGISDDGMTIVGSGFNPNGVLEGWIVQLDSEPSQPIIPEPSTILLFGSGLFGLAMWRWKKNKTE